VRTSLTPTPASDFPTDFIAIVGALQDQVDDLTATVEAHQYRLDELTGSDSATAKR